MKLELLQSISVAVLSVGLFLSALGAFGTYYFGGKSERKTASVEFTEPDLPVRGDPADERLEAIVEPVTEAAVVPPPEPTPAPPTLTPVPPTAPPQKPAPATADLIVKPPPPVAEKLAAAKPEEAAPAPPSRIMPEPEPPVPAKTIATKEAPAASKPHRMEGLGIEPWQTEKMLQRLRTFDHGTITIQAPEGSDEASRLAAALKEAFVAAGWRVVGVNFVKAGTDPKGITLSSGSFPPPPEVTTVFSALVSAGLKLSTDLDPSMGKQHAVLFVGSRP